MDILSSQIQWNRAPDSVRQTSDGWLESVWKAEAHKKFTVSCRIALPKTAQPFWCMPALFWGDNQQDTTKQYYPRFNGALSKPSRFQSSFWEVHVSRVAQPIAAMHDGTGWWVLEVKPDGQTGAEKLPASIGFEWKEGQPHLVASLPANERPYVPVGHNHTEARQGFFTPDSPVEVRWAVRAMRHPGPPVSLLELLEENYHGNLPSPAVIGPAKEYAAATRDALLLWHYDPKDPHFHYTMAFDRVGQQIAEASGCSIDRHEMPLGWVNGWVVFEALLDWHAEKNDSAAMQAVEATWKKLCDVGVTSPSGFWWTRYAPQRKDYPRSPFNSKLPNGMDGNWMANPHHLHMRTLGDSVWRAACMLRRHRGHLSFAAELESQVVRQAEKVAAMAKKGWPLPLSIDARTGEPAGLKGTAAMIWISVWCELAKMGLWKDTAFIREALDYYRPFVESGQLHGAPEDVGECITSEDIYIAVNTYLDGYRVTGRKEDLESCRVAARWLYLWQKSFNHPFDKRTLLGVYDLKSRGGQFASFKNNHLHIYGLDMQESLYELAKLTGNSHWRELADDHWRFSAQLTPLVDGQFNGYRGMVTEQFYFIDWSAMGNSVPEEDGPAAYEVEAPYRNHENLAGFSHAWCTAMVLREGLRMARETA